MIVYFCELDLLSWLKYVAGPSFDDLICTRDISLERFLCSDDPGKKDPDERRIIRNEFILFAQETRNFDNEEMI